MTGSAKFSSKRLKRSHLKACRMLGYVLTDGRAVAWQAFARRLEPEERAAIAWAALRSLDRETAVATLEAAFEPEQGAGMPVAPFTDFEDEAAFWSDSATPDEIAAYAVATFLALPVPKRWAFLDFAGRQAA